MGETFPRVSIRHESMVNGQSLIQNYLQFVLIGLHNVRRLNNWLISVVAESY